MESWIVSCRVYLGPSAEGRSVVVRGVGKDAIRSVITRLRKLGPLCWVYCNKPEDFE